MEKGLLVRVDIPSDIMSRETHLTPDNLYVDLSMFKYQGKITEIVDRVMGDSSRYRYTIKADDTFWYWDDYLLKPASVNKGR